VSKFPHKISIVIPALNEEHGIGDVLKEIPVKKLNKLGYDVEVMVVDNGSTDKTGHIARSHGATVIVQPVRGYGNAYKAGFANATGDIIATGDADMTYPFEDIPKILQMMEDQDLEFINTDRLSTITKEAMYPSHRFGNWVLATICQVLYGLPFNDSQSGMWIFKRYVWDDLHVKSSGMPFSQELKIEVHAKGFRTAEVPVVYRRRAGDVKLNPVKDAVGNVSHLFKKRVQLTKKRATELTKSKAKLAKVTHKA